MSDFLVLSLFLVLCLGSGAIGGLFTSKAVKSWYVSVHKPAWNPPNWVFAPVWTALYILMGVGAWIVWREGHFFGAAGVLFGVQLLLNVCWSYLFFALRKPSYALLEIMLLWIAIAATLSVFWSINRVAGAMYIPYLAWVTFASFLNLAIWRLNRGSIG